MNKEKLKNFIDLVTFDQQFLDITQKIQTLNRAHQEIQDQVSHQEQLSTDMKRKHHDAVKSLHEQELKLKELEVAENHLNDSAKNIRNVKEFDAAQKELDGLKIARNQQEQKVIQQTNKVDLITKELESYTASSQNDLDVLKQKLHEHEQLIHDAEQSLSALQKERAIKTVNIPTEWLQIYEMMRGRVKNPVVALEQESCSACFSFMSSRDLQQLRQKGLLQCKDCYRFLYIDQSVQE